MNKFLRKKLMLEMEVQKRIVAYYRAMIDHLISEGTMLSSPKLLRLSVKQDKHFIHIIHLKTQYQKVMKETYKYCEW